jgi:hypothetical protein
LGIPTAEALTAVYEEYRVGGKLTPQLQASFQQADSLLKQYQADPALRDAQRAALTRLQQEAEAGGMMLEDRLAVEQALEAAASQGRGREEAILQNMAERGVAGSGMELAARLSSAQNAANQSRAAGLQAAADARTRALQAMMDQGQLATQLRQGEFAEEEARARAQDAINQFNTGLRQNTEASNVQAKNKANEFNLTREHLTMDKNTGLANRTADNRVEATKTVYDAQRQRIEDIAGAKTGAGRIADTNAANQAASLAKAGTAAMNAGTQLIKAFSDEDEEEKKKLAANNQSLQQKQLDTGKLIV